MNERDALVILVETDPVSWESSKSLDICSFFDHLFLYLKQMILADVFNPPTIIAYNRCNAMYLYPSPDKCDMVMDNQVQLTTDEEINDYMQQILESLELFSNQSVLMKPSFGSKLDAAISLALCHLNGFTRQNIRKRIMIFYLSEDDPSAFDTTMNSIFAANRIGAVIDSLSLNQNQSLFLNQGAVITNGQFLVLDSPEYLSQYLFSIPPISIRPFFELPPVKSLNYRAPDSKSKDLIDIGYLCPYCLSVHSKKELKCSVCNDVLLPSGLKR